MAKKDEYVQSDLFPESPRVSGLGITKFEISGASVKATVEGVTNTNDIALLDNPCWQKAVAAWLISLHGCEIDEAIVSVKKAYVDYINSTGESHRPTVDSYEDAITELTARKIERYEKQEEKAFDKEAAELNETITPSSKSNGKGKAATANLPN